MNDYETVTECLQDVQKVLGNNMYQRCFKSIEETCKLQNCTENRDERFGSHPIQCFDWNGISVETSIFWNNLFSGNFKESKGKL